MRNVCQGAVYITYQAAMKFPGDAAIFIGNYDFVAHLYCGCHVFTPLVTEYIFHLNRKLSMRNNLFFVKKLCMIIKILETSDFLSIIWKKEKTS